MPTDDLDQGTVNGGEPVEPTEPTVPTEPVTPSGDPLDAIQDPAVRAEQKKIRAIYQRNKGKFEDKPEPAAQPTENFVSKNDLSKLVTGQAKEKVSAEVRDAWDELLKIPLGGYDPLDASSIAKNMEERLALHKARNPEKKNNPAAPLQTTTGTVGAGSPPSAPSLENRIKLPRQPDSWYPKTS